jgi:predicted acyltransferase
MTANNRLVSLDLFRGITIAAMILVNYPGSWKAMYWPLEHSAWAGTTPTDFIFPFFIFIVGISVTLSFTKLIEKGTEKKLIVQKTLWRALKIFAVGLLLRFLPNLDLSRMELPGVLQRIALVFLACAFLYLYTDWKTQLYIGVGILVAYWLAIMYIPVPGIGAGIIEPGKNLANWMDGVIIPASLLNKKGYDAEGFLSTFPAIATGISGLLAGRILAGKRTGEQTAVRLFVTGTGLVLAGSAWGWFFPVIKKIWTSSFVLYTSGWAMILFGSLYWLTDIQMVRKGIRPWLIFGSNAIAVYVLADLFETLHDLAFDGMLNTGVDPRAASLAWALFSVFACFLVARWMYVRKIFIKL